MHGDGDVNAPVSLQLAEWLSALRWPALPPRQQELAVLRVLDSVGLMLGGTDTEASSIARAYAARQGEGRCTMIGGERPATAGWAAFANGIAAHCWDFDDTFPDSVVHPGSIVVSTALAVGEDVGASGADILAAIAGGYEIAARLGRIGERRFHNRGFHASGIFAPVIAAFVAGRLMRLPPAAIASAAGLATSMSGGLLAFLEDGAWSKWLHFGWGNFGGILAAGLAADDFRGPLGGIDGRHNFYAAFLGEPAPDFGSVTSALGDEWRNENALFKLYPCAHVIHAYIDLALEFRKSLALDPRSVRSITASVAPWAVPIVCEPAAKKICPATTLQAIASLPFNVAAALVNGEVGIATLEAETRGRSDICELAERITYKVTDLPGFAAQLALETNKGEIHMKSGTALEANAARLQAKFVELAGRMLPPQRIEPLLRAILTLPEQARVSDLPCLLRDRTKDPLNT
jgi:2-methylcitrate dehydratase PrpD